MALSLPTKFSQLASVNSTDRIWLVHLYWDATNYLALATSDLEIGTVQYLPVVNDIGTESAVWQLLEEANSVTVATPEIELAEYTTEAGYTLSDEFSEHNFAGRRCVVYSGFKNSNATNTLADFIAHEYILDDWAIKGNVITLILRTPEIPTLEIAGRKLDATAQTIGGSAVSTIIIPPESDGQRLPVAFGEHWNAPLVCYNLKDSESHWCGHDEQWGAATIVPDDDVTQILSVWSDGVAGTKKQLLIHDDKMLVPIYETGWTGDTAFETLWHTVDSVNTFALHIIGPGSSLTIQQGGLEIISDIPIRLVYNSHYTCYTYNLGGAPANLSKVFDRVGDSASPMGFTGSGNGLAYFIINADLYLERNLRADPLLCVHPKRPIHIPSETNSGDVFDWLLLLLGRSTSNHGINIKLDAFTGRTPPDCNDSTWLTDYDAGTAHLNFCGETLFTGSGNYEQISRVGGSDMDAGWHNVDFSDTIDSTHVASAGNSDPTAVERYRTGFNYLNRAALDSALSFRTYIAGTGAGVSNTVAVNDLWFESHKVMELPIGEYAYTSLTGLQVNNSPQVLHSIADTTPYMLHRPEQYIEAILRAKGGATDSSIGSEWATIDDLWTLFFSTARDYSGFSLTDDTDLKQFIGDYIRREPFTIYRDSANAWRIPMLFADADDLADAGTTQTIDFSECDTFEMSMTPMDRVVAEIKSLDTDYVHATRDYTQKINWKLPSASYAYDYWKADNTSADNQLKIEKIQKRYTSMPRVSRVYDSEDNYWSCLRTSFDDDPLSANANMWYPLLGSSGSWTGITEWAADTWYYGEDAENWAIARFVLNFFGNRAPIIACESHYATWERFEIGDCTEFTNVPYKLFGRLFKGFGGDTTTASVTINGQAFYNTFVCFDVKRSMGKTTTRWLQMRDLRAYNPVRVN